MSYINGETVSIVVFFIGVFGLISRRNIIKSIVALSIMQTAAILYFLSSGYKEGSTAPIGNIPEGALVADPLAQAMMITDIVIGVAVTAAALTMFIHLYHRYGTTNWIKAAKKRAEK